MSDPARREVWWVRFDPSVGSEIEKVRPAVVVSLGAIGRLPLRIVVPITDWQSRYASSPWFVHLPATQSNGLRKDSGADAFQVKSVSLERFQRHIGALTSGEVEAIAGAVALCVGYNPA